ILSPWYPRLDSHQEPSRCKRGALLLRHAGLVGLDGVAPSPPLYQRGALLLRHSPVIGGPERICTSTVDDGAFTEREAHSCPADPSCVSVLCCVLTTAHATQHR